MNIFSTPSKPVPAYTLTETNTIQLFGPPLEDFTCLKTWAKEEESNAIDAGFNYETFPGLTLKSKLNCLPLAMIADIELGVPN